MTLCTTFLRMQQYSADSGYPLAALRTAHPFFCPSTFSHAASNTPPAAFQLPIYLFALHLPSGEPCIPSPAYGTAVDRVSPQPPPLAWLAAYLQASLCTSSSCAHFSAVYSLTLSLICFFIIPLWHTIGIKERSWKNNSKLSQQPLFITLLPTHLTYRFSSHLGMQSWKIEAVSLLIAFLRLRLWSAWE